MSLRTFFGKIRRKILRVILGRELIDNLTNINILNKNMEVLQNVITNDIKVLKNVITNDIEVSKNDITNDIGISKNGINDSIKTYYDTVTESIDIINQTLYHIEDDMEDDRSDIIKAINQSPTVQEINTKAFAKYRNINRGRDVVIVGSGPTLNYYEPIENAVTMGVNTTFKKAKIDYLFLMDKNVINDENKDLIIQYPCKKFFSFLGSLDWNLPIILRETKEVEEICINTVESCNPQKGYYSNIYFDITRAPVANLGSTIFAVAQFALWTYPKRIYIVGCDCTNFLEGHFDGTRRFHGRNTPIGDKRFVDGWKDIKRFRNIYYPDVEMITINPVGLKEIFKNVFTKRYIQETYSNSAVYLKGYYSDGWVRKKSRYCILSGKSGELTISGYYPLEIRPELTGKIIINEEETYISITENQFKFVLNVKPEEVTNISIEMDFEFYASPPDARKLCFVLTGINTQ
jgi:hypothetical protein